ncbi:MAG: PAS domain-containing protein, partial [Bdellovibrionia bacterium]
MSLGSDTSEELKLLTENESHLRLITETAPVSIVYIDKDERYVSINAYYEKTHARKKERVIGKTVREVVSADGYARVKPYIDTVLSGKTVSFETTIDRPGQASILIQASYVPDLDPTGKVRGFVAVSTDITQQRIAEFKLRESQESLSFALQSAKMATWEIDLKTNEILCSPEMLELWGLPKSETYLSREVILGKIHPDDVDKVRGEINGAIENGAVYDYEYRVLPVPGEIRWVHSRGRCTYEAGQDRPVKFSGFAFDITQHKNAQQAERFAREKEEWLRQEERFRLILEGVRDCAIYSLDQAGRVVTWNEGAKRIKGYDAQEVLGKDVSWFRLESERGEILFLDLKEAERAGHIEKEGWAFRKGGNRFWASVAITPLRDSEGALIGFVKVTRDLTEHKRLEQMRLDEQ